MDKRKAIRGALLRLLLSALVAVVVTAIVGIELSLAERVGVWACTTASGTVLLVVSGIR